MEKTKVLSGKTGDGLADWLLSLAITFDWPKIVHWAINNGADIDASRLYWSNKPLIWAIRKNDAPMVEWLLARGASSQIIDGRYVPFTLALRLYLNKRVSLEIVKLLAAKEKDIDALTPTGFTPIGHAIIEEDLELLKFFLSLGADANVCDEFGEPPIMTAVETGNLESCRILLNASANPNQPHKQKGLVTLSGAVWKNRADICELLLEHKADPNFRSIKTGDTCLHHAAGETDRSLYELLLRYGADPEIKNNRGLKPAEVTAH